LDESSEAAATAIYQRLLDQIGETYFANDFAGFARFVHVPHRFITESEEKLIETPTQLQTGFDKFRDYLTGVGITNFIRKCSGAMFLSPDRIIGSHMTEMISQGTRIREPYEVWSTLERIAGRWMVISSRNAISDISWQAIAMGQTATTIDTTVFTHSKTYTPKTGER